MIVQQYRTNGTVHSAAAWVRLGAWPTLSGSRAGALDLEHAANASVAVNGGGGEVAPSRCQAALNVTFRLFEQRVVHRRPQGVCAISLVTRSAKVRRMG
ncbi:hypothetical protein [Streptomyces sp. TE33382]